MKNSIGKNLGKYVLLNKLIGSGSFAKVYEGYVKSSKNRVAIKLIRRDKINDKLMSNLSYEIDSLRKINHKNVVKLFDVQFSKKYFYLILEYCCGGDLSNYMKKISKGPIRPKIARKFFIQLARGIKACRDVNLVHRDLKPQNILLTSTDATVSELKIADFGFARELHPTDLANTMCGSPSYMAPEVLNHKKYDEKVDLWSLGVILYEMLTGKLPYPANNVILLLKKYEKSKIVYPDYLGELEKDLIKKLLRKDPSKRINFDEFFKHEYLNIPGGFGVIENEEIEGEKNISSSDFEEKSKELNMSFEILGDKKLILSLKEMEDDNKNLENLVSVTSSGHVSYPKQIFNFEKFSIEENESFLSVIEIVEQKCKRAWVIAEAGFLMTKYSKVIDALSLFTKSLDLLYLAFKMLKSSCSKSKVFKKNSRVHELLKWIRNRFIEFLDNSNNLKEILSTQNNGKFDKNTKINLVENILYSYALKLAREAAMKDYLLSTRKEGGKEIDENCLAMYSRTKWILEFILYDSGQIINVNDKSALTSYIKQCGKLIKQLKK